MGRNKESKGKRGNKKTKRKGRKETSKGRMDKYSRDHTYPIHGKIKR